MTHKHVFRVLLVATVLLISYLATTSLSVPVVSHSNDKVNHLLAFVVLALLLDMSIGQASEKIKLKSTLLVLYGLSIEGVQSQLPYRSFSFADVFADILGIVIYWLLSFFILRSHIKQL